MTSLRLELSTSNLISAITEYLQRYGKVSKDQEVKNIKFGPFPRHGSQWLEMWANDTIPMELVLDGEEVIVLEFNGKN